MLQDTSLNAVIKSLVKYSTTLGSSRNASFDEARISDTCKNLQSFGTSAECGWGHLPALRLCNETIAPVSEDSPARGKGQRQRRWW